MRQSLPFCLVAVTVLAWTSGGLSTMVLPTCPAITVFSFWSVGQRADVCYRDINCLYNFPKVQNQIKKPETVHISVVACGNRLEETLIMIKSAVILSFFPLHFHIFADDQLRKQFKQRLSNWPKDVRKKFKRSIYPITYPPGQNSAEWIKVFKPCATQRLFIPYVLPEGVTDRILYVDTDVLFMRPAEHVWGFFKRFNSSHIAALAPEHEWDRMGWYNRHARHPYYGPLGVNSGVMLMDFPRMKKAKWIDRIVDYYKTYRFNITWGDQDLINVFFHFFPDMLYVYPCNWNLRPDHCMYGLNCVQAKNRGVSVVHGNRGVYHDDKQPVFKAIYKSFKDFKFGSDLETGLLDRMRDAIEEVRESGSCGREGEVFTTQLERQLNLQRIKCKKDKYCDIDTYETEDFGFEEKPKKKKSKKSKKKTEEKASIGSKNSPDTVKSKEPNHEEDTNALKINQLSKDVISSLQTKFEGLQKNNFLSIMKEHYARVKDAVERNQDSVRKPQLQVNEELLSGSLHEEMLGYLQSKFKFMESSKEYVKVMEKIVHHIQETNSDSNVSTDNAQVQEELQIAVVACGDRLEEPLMMMKSAMLLSKRKIRFHLFAEEHLQPQFKQTVGTWPDSVRARMELMVYGIKYPPGQSEDAWKKLFKLCATQRIFIPDLLPDVDSLLYVDTDILFLRPVEDIWDKFLEFNATQISGLCPEHEDAHVSWYKRFARHPYYPPLGVNSGVMLMNLTRMRKAEWVPHMVKYFHIYRYNTTWGDQDLINIFFHFYPDKLYIFPCDWNYRQDHCMYMHVCKLAEDNGVSILHGARQVYHNEKERSFKGVYEAIRDYQFGDDLKTNLLEKMKQNVKTAANTSCGKVGWVLSKQLEKQIENLDKSQT